MFNDAGDDDVGGMADDVGIPPAQPPQRTWPGAKPTYEWVQMSEDAPVFGPEHALPGDIESLVERGRTIGWRRRPMFHRARPRKRSVSFSIDMRDCLDRLERNPAWLAHRTAQGAADGGRNAPGGYDARQPPPAHQQQPPTQHILRYAILGEQEDGAPSLDDTELGSWLEPTRLDGEVDGEAGILVQSITLKHVANQWPVGVHLSVTVGDEERMVRTDHFEVPGVDVSQTRGSLPPAEQALLALPTSYEVAASRSAIPMAPGTVSVILEPMERTGRYRPNDAAVIDVSLDKRAMRQANGIFSGMSAKCVGPYASEEDLRGGVIQLGGGNEWVVVPPDHATLQFILRFCTALCSTNPAHAKAACEGDEDTTLPRHITGYVVGRDIFERGVTFIRTYVAPCVLRVRPQDIRLQVHPTGCGWDRLQEYIRREQAEHEQLRSVGRAGGRGGGGGGGGGGEYISPQLAGTLTFEYLCFAPKSEASSNRGYRAVWSDAIAKVDRGRGGGGKGRGGGDGGASDKRARPGDEGDAEMGGGGGGDAGAFAQGDEMEESASSDDGGMG